MAEPHLDHPGEIHWFSGEGPAAVLGPCPHAGCKHLGQGVIAWGPTLERYELVKCGTPGNVEDGRCAGACRAWVDGRGRVTSKWLQIQPAEAVPRLITLVS
jgi:hypothetical protein